MIYCQQRGHCLPGCFGRRLQACERDAARAQKRLDEFGRPSFWREKKVAFFCRGLRPADRNAWHRFGLLDADYDMMRPIGALP